MGKLRQGWTEETVFPSKFINFTLSWTYAAPPTPPPPLDLKLCTVREIAQLSMGGGLCRALCRYTSEQQRARESIRARGWVSHLDAEQDLTLSLCSSDQPPASASATLGGHTQPSNALSWKVEIFDCFSAAAQCRQARDLMRHDRTLKT